MDYAPSISSLRKFRATLDASNARFIKQLSEKCAIIDVRHAITSTIQKFIANLDSESDSPTSFIIKLTADGTVCGRKSLVNYAFTLINDEKTAKGPAGIKTIAYAEGAEDYENLEDVFSHIMHGKMKFEYMFSILVNLLNLTILLSKLLMISSI